MRQFKIRISTAPPPGDDEEAGCLELPGAVPVPWRGVGRFFPPGMMVLLQTAAATPDSEGQPWRELTFFTSLSSQWSGRTSKTTPPPPPYRKQNFLDQSNDREHETKFQEFNQVKFTSYWKCVNSCPCPGHAIEFGFRVIQLITASSASCHMEVF